jgi:hypothetical protein
MRSAGWPATVPPSTAAVQHRVTPPDRSAVNAMTCAGLVPLRVNAPRSCVQVSGVWAGGA